MNTIKFLTITFMVGLLFCTSAMNAETYYVQGGADPAGLGGQNDPFDTLAKVEAASAINDLIIVLPSAIPLNGGIRLKDGQEIQGAGGVDRVGDPCVDPDLEGDNCGNENIFEETGERSIITNTNWWEREYNLGNLGNGIILAKDNIVHGLHITGTVSHAITNESGSDDLGDLRISENVISGCSTYPIIPTFTYTYINWDFSWYEGWWPPYAPAFTNTRTGGIVLVANTYSTEMQNIWIHKNVLRPSDAGVVNTGTPIAITARRGKIDALVQNNFVRTTEVLEFDIVWVLRLIYGTRPTSIPANFTISAYNDSEIVANLVKNVSIDTATFEGGAHYDISVVGQSFPFGYNMAPKIDVNVKRHHSELSSDPENLIYDDPLTLLVKENLVKNVAGILVFEEGHAYNMPIWWGNSPGVTRPTAKINVMVEKSTFIGGTAMLLSVLHNDGDPDIYGDFDQIDLGGGPLGSKGDNTVHGQLPSTDGVLQLHNQGFYAAGKAPIVWALNNDWGDWGSYSEPPVVIIGRPIAENGQYIEYWHPYVTEVAFSTEEGIVVTQRNKELTNATYLGTVTKNEPAAQAWLRPDLEEVGLNSDDYIKYDFDLYHFEYDTVRMYDILNNNSDPLSGAIENRAFLSIPHTPNTIEPLPIVIYFPGTRFNRDYEDLQNDLQESYLFSSSGFIVLVHYPVGTSTSIDLDLHPYDMRLGYGTSAKDMLIAAKDLLDENGINYSDELFITGYSEGGYAALSVAKMFQEFDTPIPVTAVAPLAGAFRYPLRKDYFFDDRPPVAISRINITIKLLLAHAFNFEGFTSIEADGGEIISNNIDPTFDKATYEDKLEENALALFLEDPDDPNRQFASTIIDAYKLEGPDLFYHQSTYFVEKFLKLPPEEQNLATILNPALREALESEPTEENPFLGENHPFITTLHDLFLLNAEDPWQLNSPTRFIVGGVDGLTFKNIAASDYFRKQVESGDDVHVDALLTTGNHFEAIQRTIALAVDFFRNPVTVQQEPVPPRPAGVTRFASIGDFGYVDLGEYGFPGTTGSPAHIVAELVKSWDPDFIITMGDNNYGDRIRYGDGSPDTIDHNVGQLYNEYIYPYIGEYAPCAEPNPDPNKCPGINRFFPTVGNHEYYAVPGSDELTLDPHEDYFTLPGNERYYDFDQGPVHFFALNSDVKELFDIVEIDGIKTKVEDPTQYNWLRDSLEDCVLNHSDPEGAIYHPWKIVYMHHTPYSVTPGRTEDATLRWPFADWGASVVLSGHDHNYQRIVGLDGLTYMVNGLGGGGTYAIDPEKETDGTLMAKYNSLHGAMLIDASDTEITFKMINIYGQAVDTFTLTEQP